MIKLYYWKSKENAGDYLSSWILDKMNISHEFSNNANLGISGSILSNPQLKNAKIWGCGFHNETDITDNKEIFAVRGDLTRKKLKRNDIVIGDPGTLVSYFYNPKNDKKYKFGIISHYIDYSFFKSLKLPSFVKLITMGTNDVEKVLDEINECEFTLSSSLHGIIFSHSYCIPSIHIKHNELASKKSFKFLDYYSNFKLKYLLKNINSQEDLDWEEFDLLYKNKFLFTPTIDEIKQKQKDLLDVFPFKDEFKK